MDLDVQALSRLEVHDVDIEIVIRCHGEQLAQGKYLPRNRQHRLVFSFPMQQFRLTLQGSQGGR